MKNSFDLVRKKNINYSINILLHVVVSAYAFNNVKCVTSYSKRSWHVTLCVALWSSVALDYESVTTCTSEAI